MDLYIIFDYSEKFDNNGLHTGNSTGRLLKQLITPDICQGDIKRLPSNTKTHHLIHHSMENKKEEKDEEKREDVEMEDEVEGEGKFLTIILNLFNSITLLTKYPSHSKPPPATCSYFYHRRSSGDTELKLEDGEEEELLGEKEKKEMMGGRKRRKTEGSEVSIANSGTGPYKICRKIAVIVTLRTRRIRFSCVCGARNLIMPAHLSLRIFQNFPRTAILRSAIHFKQLMTGTPSESGEQDIGEEEVQSGTKRERGGGKKKEEDSGKKKKIDKRSDAARARRKERAKERWKRAKLRKKTEKLSIHSPQKKVGTGSTDPPPRGDSSLPQPAKNRAGMAKKHPPQRGDSAPSQSAGSPSGAPALSLGSREDVQSRQGNGDRPPQAARNKHRVERPATRTTDSQETGDLSNRSSTPKNGAVKPSSSGKQTKKRGSRPSGQPHHVFLRIDGAETATEENRRSLMEYLAVSIATRPSSSGQTPVFVTDSRIEPDGSIRMSGADENSAGVIRGFLEARGDIRILEGPGTLRRLVFGGPGYLNNMSPVHIQLLLENQNPELPRGSLRVVSVDKDGRNPLFFVEVTDEGFAFLKGRNFVLDSMTSKIFFHPAGGKKDKSSSK